MVSREPDSSPTAVIWMTIGVKNCVSAMAALSAMPLLMELMTRSMVVATMVLPIVPPTISRHPMSGTPAPNRVASVSVKRAIEVLSTRGPMTGALSARLSFQWMPRGVRNQARPPKYTAPTTTRRTYHRWTKKLLIASVMRVGRGRGHVQGRQETDKLRQDEDEQADNNGNTGDDDDHRVAGRTLDLALELGLALEEGGHLQQAVAQVARALACPDHGGVQRTEDSRVVVHGLSLIHI